MLSQIVAQLKAEHQALTERRTALRDQLKGIEAEVKPIEGALRELGEKPLAGKNGKQKPAATKADVIATIEQVLSSSTPAGIDALKKEVEAQITASGRSRNGFALRFKEAIQSEQFAERGYRLKLRADGDDQTAA